MGEQLHDTPPERSQNGEKSSQKAKKNQKMICYNDYIQ